MASYGGDGGGAWSTVPARSRRAGTPAPAPRGGCGERRLDKCDIPVEVSGEGAPPPADGFEAAGLGEAVLRDVARCGYESPTHVQRYAMPIAKAERDLMACAQTGSGKTAASCLPVVSGLVAAGGYGSWDRGSFERRAKPRALVLAPTRELAAQEDVPFEADRIPDRFVLHIGGIGDVVNMPKESRQTEQQIELPKENICNPRSEAFPIGGERTGENQHCSTGTCKTHRQGCGGSCRIYSLSWRKWILALFVLLSACTNSVAGMSCGPDNNICSAEGVSYADNFCPAKSVKYDKFCPAEAFQYKRVKRDEYSIESNLPMCKESECRETVKKETECKDKSIDVVALTAALFTFTANLGPMVPILNAHQVSPDRRRMLCMTSVYLATSSCSWIIYLGPEHCINWFSYCSLTIALLLHSFYAWLFWRENHALLSLPSLFTFLGSSVLAIGISFLSRTKFVKIGTGSDFAKSTPAAAAGILGPLLTLLVIWYKRRSKNENEQIKRYTCTNIFCAVFGTSMFIYCIHWLEKGNINRDIMRFKVGISMTGLYQLYEVG